LFSAVYKRKETITLEDLLISEQQITAHLRRHNFPELETDKIEQLSATGLALVANHYNMKGDQHCWIYVASTTEDLISITRNVNYSANGERVVVIFQPTDGAGSYSSEFPDLHKTVIYLQKNDDNLHVVHADSVHAAAIEEYIFAIINSAVGYTQQFAFYTQSPIVHPFDQSWLHMLAGYTQCGVHALRIARKIAKCEKFLDSLQLVEANYAGLQLLTAKYQLPLSFALNADSSATRKELLTMYANHSDRPKLEAHFARFVDKGQYAGKFSRKYIDLVTSLVGSNTPQKLVQNIDRADARNFKLRLELFDIYCIGSAHVDRISKLHNEPSSENGGTATSTFSYGGVGYIMALALKKFENNVAMGGLLGSDPVATQITENINQHGINCEAMIQVTGFSTACYTAVLKPSGEVHFDLIDKNIYDQITISMVEPHLEKLVRCKNWVFDSDYPVDVYKYFATVAKAHSINVFVTIACIFDVEKVLPLLGNAKALFGNVAEISRLAGSTNLTSQGIQQSLTVIAAYGTKNVFATDGANGVHVLSQGIYYFKPAVVVETVVSVNGAGDTFAAAAISSMLCNDSMDKTIDSALTAAALRVEGKEVNAAALGAELNNSKSIIASAQKLRVI
jgi:pseudouridine kinase